MKQIDICDFRVPFLGQGTWNMGNSAATAEEEIKTLRLGLELGMNLFDTAELYGDGKSEELVRRALGDIKRDEYFLVSKVKPENAGRKDIFRSCEASLRRLGTDYLDVYLLHWRGYVPLEETVDCMEELVKQGKIRCWGVSNFDVWDMTELWNVPNGNRCAVNQVLYHLGSRGVEFDLWDWLREHNVVPMAYSPLAQAGKIKDFNKNLLAEPTLLVISAQYNISIYQLLLAFSVRSGEVLSIPKASHPGHVRANAQVADLEIAAADWEIVDKIVPPPTEPVPLDMD